MENNELWIVLKEKKHSCFRHAKAIVKPRSVAALDRMLTRNIGATFYYGKTKTGRSRLDHAVIGLVFSEN